MLDEGMAPADDWFTRLKEEITADGRSNKVLSLAAGLGQNYVQQMIAKDQPPKIPTLEKLLVVLGADAARRVRPDSAAASEVREANISLPSMPLKDVPVLGTAAGGDYAKGAFQLTPDAVDYVRRPPGLMNAKEIYALYVEGSSMVPRFEPGELIYVNPNRPVRPGDYVVIQEPVDEDTTRGFVKQFVKRSGEWVVVRQLNPAGEMRFKPQVKVHRVLTVTDLMGV
jgi:phage repressor protein C with HTH and peptisase S24 domain